MDAFFDEGPAWHSGYARSDGKPDGMATAFFNRIVERKDFHGKISITLAFVLNSFAYDRRPFPSLFRPPSAYYVWNGGFSAFPYAIIDQESLRYP